MWTGFFTGDPVVDWDSAINPIDNFTEVFSLDVE